MWEGCRRQLDYWPLEVQAQRGMQEIPLKIFINPTIKILDSAKVCVAVIISKWE
jgi:hypothetical protein